MGFWHGECRKADKYNPQGYYENIWVHRKLREVFGRDWVDGDFPCSDEKFDTAFRIYAAKHKKSYGPWFVKVGAFYARCFDIFDPVFVKVWRDPELVVNSLVRTNMLSRLSESELRVIVARQHEYMKSFEGLDIKIG